MRKTALIMIIALGASTTLWATDAPAQARYQQCIKGRGCVPATQRTYDYCFNLALARGESAAWGERRRLDWFIYQCLAGRIPG